VARTFLLGLLAILPLGLTVMVLVWAVRFIVDGIGPGSTIGNALTSLGLSVGGWTGAAYLIGVLLVVIAIYLLGLILQYGLKDRFSTGMAKLIKRIPLVGGLYDLSTRMVGLIEPGDQPDLKAMSPVWCQFGGEGGATVLAFQTQAEPVDIGGEAYCCVLVPSAPVPVGGGLIFVPVSWVMPADVGAEGMLAIYMSMGTAAGNYMAKPTTTPLAPATAQESPPPNT
jgi:uncharacterized membrane protein